MYKKKKITAIIAAAGLGSRMNANSPKQYLEIDGKPMLIKAAEAFDKNDYVDDMIVVTNSEYQTQCEDLFKQSGIKVTIVTGGRERQDSVNEALKRLPDGTDYVLVHDAARPFITDELICETIHAVTEKRAVVCSVPVKDSIRMKTEKEKTIATDRSLLYAVQTPQAFEKQLITDAYTKAYADGFYGTDDASVAERAGYTVYMINGSYENIKITTKGDMPVNNNEIRIGTGFDVHAFQTGRKLFLGGVEIPFEKGLLGHSDADVLIHAVIDALLGAASLGDIGRLFPDDEQKYKDISSLLLLEETNKTVMSQGYEIGNIDVTVIAEKPKISAYISEMIKTIAKTLDINENKINIKGTTTEKLGFTGREEGIAAQAVCTLRQVAFRLSDKFK